MKLTTRMKHALVQSFIANLVFLCIFLGIGYFVVYPKIQNIETMKTDLGTISTTLNTIRKDGLSYDEVQLIASENSDIQGDEYTQTILQNVNEDFYTQIFSHTGTESFDEFLNTKKAEIVSEKTSQDYIDKDLLLQTILPVYSQEYRDEDAFNDFYFTNYLENLLYSFNLTSVGMLGIQNIQKVENNQQNDTGESEGPMSQNSLQEDIFKIPLNFTVTGQKSDIIDFIHFFEKVGAFSIQDGKIFLYTDKFISKKLTGAPINSNYNIYKNQLADISKISMVAYPDSSSIQSNNDIISLIKSTNQSREKYEVTMDINFYVSGIPIYLMKKYIDTLKIDFEQVYTNIEEDAKKYTTEAYNFSSGKEIQAIQQIQGLYNLIYALRGQIASLEAGLVESNDLNEVYTTAIKIRGQFDSIKSKYQEQKNILHPGTN